MRNPFSAVLCMLRHGPVSSTRRPFLFVAIGQRVSSPASFASHAAAASGSGRRQSPYLSYTAGLSLDRTTILVDGKPVELRPGMTVAVEINTGTRRVIDYLLSPLLR